MYSAQIPRKSPSARRRNGPKTALQPIAPPRLSSQDSTVENLHPSTEPFEVPPPRSYHLHGGTFLDFATILLGFRTRIGFTSFVVPRPKIGPQTGPCARTSGVPAPDYNGHNTLSR